MENKGTLAGLKGMGTLHWEGFKGQPRQRRIQGWARGVMTHSRIVIFRYIILLRLKQEKIIIFAEFHKKLHKILRL